MTIVREDTDGIFENKPQSDVCGEPTRKAKDSMEKSAAPPFVGETHHAAEIQRQKNVVETPAEEPSRLFPHEESTLYRSRWDSIQAGFVDEPHRAVKQADVLVTEVIKRLTQVFADERIRLEAKFDAKDQPEASTEELRLALRQYRTFFGRLLAL
jgi:hypothetical protein